MAYTVVPTKVPGDIFTETMWDTYVRDNFNTGVQVKLADTTLTGTAATISFTGISQAFSHLDLRLYLRGDSAVTTLGVGLRFNSDASANYDRQIVQGNAASPQAAEGFGNTSATFDIVGASGGASLFTAVACVIPEYSSANQNKVVQTHDAIKFGTASGNMYARGQHLPWRSNSPIVSIDIVPFSGNFVAGSRATLYAIP